MDGKIVTICRPCDGTPVAPTRTSTTKRTQCADCHRMVPITVVIPRVRAGIVVQQCADCAAGRTPVVAAEPVPPPPAPAINWRPIQRGALVVALLAFVAAPGWVSGVAQVDIEHTVDTEIERSHRVVVRGAERPLAYAKYMASDTRPVRWHHPLAGDRRLPRSKSRRFGAHRPRAESERGECGRGHCGVDLGHRRGEVVHAAADGIVDKILRYSDGRSGRYVRIRHSSGYTSFYMHLDRVHPHLNVGDEVRGGDAIGTMGHTGIEHSSPHLHFAIRHTDERERERFVDPEPLLRRATVRSMEAPFPGPDQG